MCGAKILRKSSGKIRDKIFKYLIERNFGKRILYSSGDFEYFGFLNGFYTGEGENAI